VRTRARVLVPVEVRELRDLKVLVHHNKVAPVFTLTGTIKCSAIFVISFGYYPGGKICAAYVSVLGNSAEHGRIPTGFLSYKPGFILKATAVGTHFRRYSQ
jgi:hypothetical protein